MKIPESHIHSSEASFLGQLFFLGLIIAVSVFIFAIIPCMIIDWTLDEQSSSISI